jgi:hypothetical protein
MLAALAVVVLGLAAAPQDRDVARLVKQALERDPVESRAAIEHLGAFGERGVPGLGEVLERGKVLARSMALVEVQKLGPAAVSILPSIVERLPALEPAPAADLLQAMSAQQRVGSKARVNLAFEKSLSTWSGAAWDARELEAFEAALAAEALAAVAKADLAAALEACLAEPKRAKFAREGYEAALVALARAAEEPIEGALEALLPCLAREEPPARRFALAAFAAAGKKAEFAREGVAAALADKERSVAAAAAEALMWIGGECATFGPRLAALAGGNDARLAVHAARAWWSLCPEDPAPRAALRARLAERDADVRATVVMGLARLLSEPEDADVAVFTRALADREVHVRLAAAEAAYQASERFGALRPALERASMKEEDPAVKEALTRALKEMP